MNSLDGLLGPFFFLTEKDNLRTSIFNIYTNRLVDPTQPIGVVVGLGYFLINLNPTRIIKPVNHPDLNPIGMFHGLTRHNLFIYPAPIKNELKK